MPYAQVNGNNIYYLDEGVGASLFFIHGLGGDHHMFDPQFEFFRKKYRVIAPDLRGNGLSGRLTGPVHSILDRQCDDLAGLMEKLEINRAVFCGTSFGGTFCLHFALRYPKRVVGMVISDAFSDTKVRGITEALIYSFHLLTIWTSYLPRPCLFPILSRVYRRWPIAQDYAINVAKRIRKHELVLQRLTLVWMDYSKYLPQIHCPVLGIVGDRLTVSIQCMKRAMGLIPKASFEIVEDSFDPTNLCQVARYNILVENYLSKLSW
jgi:pimeloyl-ACP methyl ester carboxylesterase